MNRPFIAGNWKMNMLQADSKDFFRELNARNSALSGINQIDTVICVPFTLLHLAEELLKGQPESGRTEIGAQNCHWEQKGAFTGEVSPQMLKDLNIGHVIIGHSERRQYFGETDTTVNRRMIAALDSGLTPIVCIGEYLEDRKAEKTTEVITSQMRSLLSTGRMNEKVVVAYEPVWAIGTGLAATPKQAQEVHLLIRQLLSESMGDLASQIRIVYGGSMNPGNVHELLREKDIDGGLIGGASLKPQDFSALIEAGIERANLKV